MCSIKVVQPTGRCSRLRLAQTVFSQWKICLGRILYLVARLMKNNMHAYYAAVLMGVPTVDIKFKGSLHDVFCSGWMSACKAKCLQFAQTSICINS